LAGDRIDLQSMARFKDRLRELLCVGRGRSLQRTIEDLTPLLRGWFACFGHPLGVMIPKDLEQWLRRRCSLMRLPCKHPDARRWRLIGSGLDAERAWKSTVNGHGPWSNAGATHLSQAVPIALFNQMRLVPLPATQRRLPRVP